MDHAQADQLSVQGIVERPSVPIVGIGASAGGLEALRELLRFLPVDTGMAYVFVQHLDPLHKSLLPAQIARATPMEVCEASERMVVKANHVYVIAPNTDLSLDQGVLTLRPQTTTRGQHLAIDTFLRSLAEDCAAQAIGVLLSGMAFDGTAGLEAIKAQSGMTMAQDARSARYAMMPQHAIAAGCVDFIGSPEEIARELLRISRYPSVQQSRETPTEQNEEGPVPQADEQAFLIQEQAFGPILSLLHQKMGVDFTAYKPTTLTRRILRRMALQHLDNTAAYLTYLHDHLTEMEALYQDLLIGVTRFFRDSSTCPLLTSNVFERLIETKSPRDPIRVWIAGCSTGEEVYSLAMCLLEFLAEHADAHPLLLFGTDLNPRAIEQARAGRYTPAAVEGLSPARLERFFQPVKGGYQVNTFLRECCIFARHDLLRDPPFSRLDLLSCQNVLIYLQPDVQQKLIQIFHYALLPQGVLLLGTSETIRDAAELFTHEGSRTQPLYRKKVTSTRPPFFGPVSRPGTDLANRLKEEHHMPYEERTSEGTLQKEADYLLLERYAPASLVIDAEQEIRHFRGPISPYLEPTSGKASLNLFKMVRESLRLELRVALGQARKSGHAVKKAGISLGDQNLSHEVTLEVIPLKDRAFLVLFAQESGSTDAQPASAIIEVQPASQGKPDSRERRIRQLEQELAAKREEMRAIIEEMEATNEELQAANEEILSSNEELQSLNEELETSKEEIQASNEELLVVNQELSLRNTDLRTARAYAEAIVETIREPLLILDAQMHVQSANPAFYQFFQVEPTAIEHHPLFELENKQWDIPALRTLLEELLPTNHALANYTIEFPFPRIGRKTLLLNAHRIDHIPLVLLAMEDITALTQAVQDKQKLLEQREDFMAIASHELKTPVTSIKGYTQMLHRRFRQVGDEQAAMFLGKMDEQLNKLIRLIGELLDLTKMEAGQLPWHNEEFDLAILVRDTVEAMAHTSTQHQIHIEGTVSLAVIADRERISQVLINLLSNALKYSPQADTVLVKLRTEQDSTMIGVQDFGIGIDPSKQAHLFERFFRVSDAAHETFPGLGLGLYISAQIVKRQGGRMWVESRPGEGSTFFFTIPHTSQPAPEPSQKEEAEHAENHPDRRG